MLKEGSNMLKKIMILSLAFLLISCSNGDKIMKYSPGDKWEVSNSEYDFSYNLEFLYITNEGFELKLINNSSRSYNYNLVLSSITDVEYIRANDELIFISAEGVFPICYYDIPEFEDEMIIYFHFVKAQNYKKISTSFNSVFVNNTGTPKYGISIDLYKY